MYNRNVISFREGFLNSFSYCIKQILIAYRGDCGEADELHHRPEISSVETAGDPRHTGTKDITRIEDEDSHGDTR